MIIWSPLIRPPDGIREVAHKITEIQNRLHNSIPCEGATWFS